MTKIFISYSHQDKEIAQWIASALSLADLKFSMDVHDVSLGNSIVGWMEQALSEAKHLILLISRASMASKWVKKEWESALHHGIPIVPVRLDDTDAPFLLAPFLQLDLRLGDKAGLAKLIAHFQSEAEPIKSQKLSATSTGVFHPSLRSRLTMQNVRQAALHCMDAADFQSLLYDFNISDNDIGGSGLAERIVLLLARLRRDEYMGELLDFFANEPRMERCLSRFLERKAA